MATITISGYDDIERKLPKVNPRAVLAAGASEYKAQWQAHFRGLDAKGNRRGFPGRHFWIEEGYKNTTVAELTPELARVVCNSAAVSFQANGGTIRPRSAGALSIPVSPVAYAAGWPSNSGLPLRFEPMRSKKNAHFIGRLVEAEATAIGYSRTKGVINKGENTKTAGTVHYILFDEITKRVGMGDGVRPDKEIAQTAVNAKMAEAFRRQQGME